MKKPSFSRVLFDCGIVVPRRQRSDYVSRHSQLVNDSAWEENTTMKEVASFMNKDGLCLFIKSCRKNPSKTTLISKKIKKHTRSMFCMFIFFSLKQKNAHLIWILYLLFFVKQIQIIPASLFYSTAIICLICAMILLDLSYRHFHNFELFDFLWYGVKYQNVFKCEKKSHLIRNN